MTVTTFIEAVVSAISGFVTGLVSALVDTMGSLLFTGTGETAALTPLAVILICGIGLGIAYWVIDKVIGLVRLGRRG